MPNSKGFTLVEVIVVMAIFIGVIVMTSSAFENILRTTIQQTKSAETQIEGIVGLETLRYDIEHAGYGLLTSFRNMSSAYSETGASTGVAGITTTAYNDTVPNPPRPVAGGVGATGLDYLVVKSAIATMSTTGKRWSYVNYSSSADGSAGAESYIRKWSTSSETKANDLQSGDRVITLNSAFDAAGNMQRQLVGAGGTYSYNLSNAGTLGDRGVKVPVAGYRPIDPTLHYMVYAIANGTDLSFPYNRADFFVKRPGTGMPVTCNAGTGILYKAQVAHGSGAFTHYPLFDCVGDMQVIYQLDMDGDSTAKTWAGYNSGGLQVTSDGEGADATSVAATMASAELLRQRLKQVHVYLLTHEGGLEAKYTYPGTSIVVGDPAIAGVGRTWNATNMAATFGANWQRYRWKVFTVSVRPKNLN